MATQLNLSDPRTVKAIAVLTGCGQWLKVRARDGRTAFGVPSQRVAGLYYMVTSRSCTCEDFARHARHGGVCKHMLAARIHLLVLQIVDAGGEIDVLGLVGNLVSA